MKLQCLFMIVAIPLNHQTGWLDLKFSRTPPNKIEFATNGLQIRVDRSASPLVFKLEKSLKIVSFATKLEITGDLNVPDAEWPGDAYLRVGLVASGTRTLGRVERLMAADWIQQLFKLAMPGQGVDKIYFFNLTAVDSFIGQKRILPKSKELIEETIVARRPSGEKDILFHHSLPRPLEIVAVWISSDGDDSQSKFDVLLKSLNLTTAPQ